MALSKYKCYTSKKLNAQLVSSLRKENAYLRTTLVDLSRQHSDHYKLVQSFLSLEMLRLENCKDKKAALSSEQLSEGGSILIDVVNMQRKRIISTCATEIEEIQKKLVNASTKCQHREKKVAERQRSLKKNKQWLEYDQQREAYVREILSRLLWLEKQLNEANQGSSRHNEDHSDEKMREMQEHYETLLQKAKDELEVLREKVDMTHKNLQKAEKCCRERKMEVEELIQQLKIEKAGKQSATEGHHYPENEAQQPKDLQCRQNEEKLVSASFELQKFLINLHLADEDKITELERQIKISLQDLEDERQNCSYLTKKIIKILTLQKTKDQVTKESQQDHGSCAVTHTPFHLSRQPPTSSTHSSFLDTSFLECPGCQTKYPAGHYKELINHLEICLT